MSARIPARNGGFLPTAKPPQRQRGGRTGGPVRYSLWHDGDLCGNCTGTRKVWCPDCGGFAGCDTCKHTCEVACAECAGGDRKKFCP